MLQEERISNPDQNDKEDEAFSALASSLKPGDTVTGQHLLPSHHIQSPLKQAANGAMAIMLLQVCCLQITNAGTCI